MFKLGFIGTGNMAGAMIGGILRAGLLNPEEIGGADILESSRAAVQKKYGICTLADNRELAQNSRMLVLSLKPQFYAGTIEEIRDCIRDGQVILTIAPGVNLKWLESAFGCGTKIIRAMPNTPAMVGEGMTAVCRSKFTEDTDMETAMRYLNAFGKAEEVPEHLMDAVTAISGSSPAYVFLFIEAMADAGVAGGMPRDQAYRFAAQAVLGSARMVLETGEHPAVLKDKVCSPGGTTIEAVRVLEKAGMRSAVIEAVKACAEKSEKMIV